MFPVAQKQFASMAAMRAVQPKMKAIQERYKDDKPKLQQEMMKLYKEEKVNPAAGCLPILLQIPIFYALYKVLMVSIEMRHQPFALWIKDLSAPDPLTPVNLFGLLDFTPPCFLAIGVLPILLGITMWLQFKLNPAADGPDPAADLRDHAVGDDVRDGAVRRRPAALLGDQQRPDDRCSSGGSTRRYGAARLRHASGDDLRWQQDAGRRARRARPEAVCRAGRRS